MIRYRGITIDRETMTIRHAGHTAQFVRPDQRVKFGIMKLLILSNGIGAKKLFDLIYGDDPDGGPLEGPHVMHIKFKQWAATFAVLNLQLVNKKAAGIVRYELVPNVTATARGMNADPQVQPVIGRSHVANLLRAGL